MHLPLPRSRRPRLPAIFAALLVALLVLMIPGAWARADTIPDAITSVSVRQDSAPPNSWVTVDVAWRVPDRTQEGSTFTLGLPPELQALGGTGFDLQGIDRTSGEQGVVAHAAIDHSSVTFTMTSWAAEHVNVSGSAFFAAKATQAEEGTLPVVFTVDGVAFTDQVQIVPRPPGDYSNTANKWATWLTNPPPGIPADERMLWAINGPRIAGPAPITFRDEPGPGQAIACGAPLMQWGTSNTGGVKTEGSFSPDQWTIKECSPSLLVVELRPRSSDVGRIPVLLGRSTLTQVLPEYRNSGSVTIGGGTIPVSTHVAWAGGQGIGDSPSPTATVPASPPETPTVPGGVPPTQTVTVPAATVTVPGQPVTAPGETVTVYPGVPPAETVTLPGETVTVNPGVPPAQTVTVPGPTVTVPGQTVTIPASATAVAGAANPSSTPPQQRGVAPSVIDTGIASASSVDGRLVAVGLGVLLASGLGFLALARRRNEA